MTSQRKPKIAIIDYGMGNLFSVNHACVYAGMKAVVTANTEEIISSDAVILPGVGAFANAMDAVKRLDLVDTIREVAASGKYLVGICLGMQLLMSVSYEFGKHQGLNLIPGEVVRFDNPRSNSGVLKVPHVCWNQLHRARAKGDPWAGTLLGGMKDGVCMYFVHSFYVKPEVSGVTVATTSYGHIEFCSALQKNNIMAFQCHPEKSGPEGLKVYQNLSVLLAERIRETET